MDSLQSSVRRVLTSAGIKKIKPFQIGANHISASNYSVLASVMRYGGKPEVKYYSKLEASGIYEPGPNTLWFRFPSADNLVQESVIVHEATHAILDMYSARIMVGDAETMAYIAQCQYFILNNKNPDKRLMDEKGEGTLKDYVFELAMSVAWTLLNNGTPTAADYHELRQAVSNDPEYYRDFFTIASYNGIELA